MKSPALRAAVVFLPLLAALLASAPGARAHSIQIEGENAPLLTPEPRTGVLDLGPPKGHHCIHDDLAMSHSHLTSRVAQEYPHIPLKPEDLHLIKRDPSFDNRTWHVRGPTGQGSLRLLFDTQYLGQTGKDCTSVGQSVTVSGYAYTCTANDILTTTKLNYLVSTILPGIQNFWTRALQVQQIAGNLLLTATTCGADGGVPVPAKYRSPGVPGIDIVVFVTSWPVVDLSPPSTTLAWAIECATDQVFRPIAGQINFTPKNIDLTAAKLTMQLSTGIHEMAHVLGFSSNKWNLQSTSSGFINPTTMKALPIASVVKKVTMWGGKATNMLLTPKMLARASAFFGCAAGLTGMELEDSGGSGTVGSHWEKRIMPWEFMSGSASSRPSYSDITIALFEDMGYYVPDYSVATKNLFGAGMGCSFVTDQCSTWTGDNYKLCSASKDVCTMQRDGWGPCSLSTYSSCLPTWAQYFSTCTSGGSQEPDFCSAPYLTQPYSNRDCTDPTLTVGQDIYGEKYGTDSLCFYSSAIASGYGKLTSKSPKCFQYRCTAGVLQISLQSAGVPAWTDCPAAGGDVTVAGKIVGTLACPPAAEICTGTVDLCANVVCPAPAACRSQGTCSSGVCSSPFLASGTTCTLTDGTAGSCQAGTCVSDAALCNPNPCLSGGTCSVVAGVATCTCATGFTGSTCANNIQCTPSPCLNSGVCTTTTTGFSCKCSAAYSGSTCATAVNFCAPLPCLNGGVCSNKSPYAAPGYSCQCPAGFGGTTCGTAINNCVPNPCVKGTCSSSASGASCTCTAGYEGSLCDQQINNCLTNQCKNGGTCVNLVNAYSCTCAAGWEGVNCDVQTDNCASSPCLNGGTCTSQLNAYKCACPAGYSGDVCKELIDNCLPNPCFNSATCTNAVNAYSCKCLPGFSGTKCDVIVDNCAVSPCTNGGKCTNGINTFKCVCTNGFSGDKCETAVVGGCSSSPCHNDGVCVTSGTGYKCTCKAGFGGDNCDENLFCSTSPCKNKGTCYPGDSGYTCNCDGTGYSGTNCDLLVDQCEKRPCQNGASCFSSLNGYTCQCVGSFSGKNCELGICDQQNCAEGLTCRIRSDGKPLCTYPNPCSFATCPIGYLAKEVQVDGVPKCNCTSTFSQIGYQVAPSAQNTPSTTDDVFGVGLSLGALIGIIVGVVVVIAVAVGVGLYFGVFRNRYNPSFV